MRKKQILEVLLRYVGPESIRMLSTRGLPTATTEEISGTVFCSSFSNMSRFIESDSYKIQLEKLNRALDFVFKRIKKREGLIATFSGDRVVCYWKNQSLQLSEDAACLAALDLTDSTNEIKNILEFEGVALRIGIASGKFLVGNEGSTERLNFGVFGQLVDLALRLNDINKVYETSVLVCGFPNTKIQNTVVTREVDRVRVIGFQNALSIIEPICKSSDLTDSQKKMISLYEDAYQMFKNSRFKEAQKAFDELAKRHNDHPSRLYAERCKKFIDNPPPNGWNGIYHFENG